MNPVFFLILLSIIIAIPALFGESAIRIDRDWRVSSVDNHNLAGHATKRMKSSFAFTDNQEHMEKRMTIGAPITLENCKDSPKKVAKQNVHMLRERFDVRHSEADCL